MSRCLNEELLENKDKLRLRLLEVKSNLRSLGIVNYTTFFILEHPEFNNSKGKSEIRKTWNGQKADVSIIEKLETLYNKLSNE